MSILELIVILIGGSVIAVQLYGAYRFWIEDADKPVRQSDGESKSGLVPSPVRTPVRAAA